MRAVSDSLYTPYLTQKHVKIFAVNLYKTKKTPDILTTSTSVNKQSI